VAEAEIAADPDDDQIDDDDDSACAFTPKEVRQLWRYWASSGRELDLMLWTMTIVSIKLFLRMDEVVNIRVEDAIIRKLTS
jgi:hypothetical protein